MKKKLTISQSRGGHSKKEYKGIDITKFIMAILVIACHANLYTNYDGTIGTIYLLVLSCVVPYFFITNGFFMYKDEETFENKLWDNLKKIIKLYIIWNIIYLPISIYDYAVNGYSVIKAIILYIRDFLFIGDHFFSWPLWYLLGFIYALIALIILKKLKLNDKKIFIITMLTYIFANVMEYLTSIGSNNIVVKLFSYVFGDGRVFTGIFLVTLGILIKKYNDKIKISKKILLLLIIVCFAISVIIPNKISEVGLYIFLFLLVKELNNIKFNTINFRRCSTIFYFVHMINLFIYMLIVGIDNTYGVYGFLITIVACMVESIIIIFIQNKWNPKILKELFN